MFFYYLFMSFFFSSRRMHTGLWHLHCQQWLNNQTQASQKPTLFWMDTRGGYRIYERGALYYIKRCRRQCIEARSADQSARSRGKFFSPSFFTSQNGLSWHLRALHCKFQDCRSQGRHELLSCSNFAHERNTYVHRGVY